MWSLRAATTEVHVPQSPWSATREARALQLERSLHSSNEDSVLPKNIIQDPKPVSPVSAGQSLGVEGGGAGQKGEPVGTGQGLLLTPGASPLAVPFPVVGGQGGERLPPSLGGTTGGCIGRGCPRCQTSFSSALMFSVQQVCGVSYHTGLTPRVEVGTGEPPCSP